VATADTWLSQLDDLIAAAADRGLYTILALTTTGNDSALGWAQADVIHGIWAFADHYKDEPAVLFEFTSSPQGWPLGWKELAFVLVGLIRQKHPASLVLISGADAPPGVGFFPLTAPTGQRVRNIIYTTSPRGEASPFGLTSTLSSLARRRPFIISTWQATDVGMALNSEIASQHFDSHGAGWMASMWNAKPGLVIDPLAKDFTPTAFGLSVRRALAREWWIRPTASTQFAGEIDWSG
jgi:hypothetical protein